MQQASHGVGREYLRSLPPFRIFAKAENGPKAVEDNEEAAQNMHAVLFAHAFVVCAMSLVVDNV